MGSDQELLGPDSLTRGQKRDHDCGGTDRSRHQPYRDSRRCDGTDAERRARQRQSDVRYSSRNLRCDERRYQIFGKVLLLNLTKSLKGGFVVLE
jgi:hypothetical protein